MNRIIVDNNKFLSNEDNVIISNNTIKFISSGEYEFDIKDSSNINIDIYVKDDVNIDLYILNTNNISGRINYNLDKNSKIQLYKFSDINNSNLEEYIYLNGEGSSINYNFSSIVSGIYNGKMKIFHNNNYVSSYINNKCVGNDGAKVYFDIDSILEMGNVSCVMDQTSKVMCMGDVDAKICPNMYIDEDDVEARHGSVIGRFSDDDIFYLMSRGINYNEAILLLIKGFIISNLGLDDEKIKMIYDVIDNKYN